MGNNHSGNHGILQPPLPWTQSLPRDAHRQKKHGAITQGTKVLPERIPGERLKPTENGRKLQVRGTISNKKVFEVNHHHPPSRGPSFANHHSSMTELNHAHPVSLLPPSSGSITDLRFNSPPSKSFVSEPDLRGVSPSSNRSLPSQQSYSVISESPTKGKIKLKKRYKAPMPPIPLQTLSFPLDSRIQPVTSTSPIDNWSTASYPDSKHLKSKPRKVGLFKKRSESRMTKYSNDDDSFTKYSHEEEEQNQREDTFRGVNERTTMPVPLRFSYKKDLKEKAQSLDNLQFMINKPSSQKQLATSMHCLKIAGHIPPEIGEISHDIENQNCQFSDTLENRQCSTLDRASRSKSKSINRAFSTLDRETRGHKLLNAAEKLMNEKQFQERKFKHKIPLLGADNVIPNYQRSAFPLSSHQEPASVDHKDEWDKAEDEWLQKMKNSENLQKEISKASSNLRKVSPNQISKLNSLDNLKYSFKDSGNIGTNEKDDVPKTFFFGMEPESLDNNSSPNMISALIKMNENDNAKVIGNGINYSGHNLWSKDKKNGFEKENWKKSLDFRERNERKDSIDTNEDSRKLDRKMDKFVATIERTKSKRIPSPEELSISPSQKGDGGYHSRQNSGSFQIGDGSDDNNVIRMNLRPILPKRQLELPRFSPNAAWRSLCAESSVRQKDSFNYIHANEDVFNISKDQILNSTLNTTTFRGTGEKSADSGISGDAGSPGPNQEFEPPIPEKILSNHGPLAVSSLSATRPDIKRTWTPAQDLDDTSLEETGVYRLSSIDREVATTLPKLTSRSNMFNKSYFERVDANFDKNKISTREAQQSHEPKYFDENILTHAANESKKSLPPTSSLKDEAAILNVDEDSLQEDTWQENWSMSRSIPNSLNTCEEQNYVSKSNCQGRINSESRISSENKKDENISRQITPSYLLQGNNGHVVYLPEYKFYQYNKAQNGVESSDLNDQKMSNDTKFSSLLKSAEVIQKRIEKKGKKFTYQSTVRMLENKKLEKQLSIEAEEKERTRLTEKEAMLKVEQEFQKKRECEKKRIKTQLKVYQQAHLNAKKVTDHNSSSSSREGTGNRSPSLQSCNSSITPPLNCNEINTRLIERVSQSPTLAELPVPQSMQGFNTGGSFQSLPVDLSDRSNISKNSDLLHPDQKGMFSGLKKWVKGKKEPRSSYRSEISNVTATSISRPIPPDRTPVSTPGRKNFNICAEIIAASRYRNGSAYLDRDSDNRSITSIGSHRRPFTPDSNGTKSPDSRKSQMSEHYPLTQELPELRQEQRLYKEYRRSSSKLLLPGIKSGLKVSPATDNYRKEFVIGNASSKSAKLDENYRYSRHHNVESRKMKQQNNESSKRCVSADPTIHRDSSLKTHRQYFCSKPQIIPIPISELYNGGRIHHNRVSKCYSSPYVDGSSTRFAQSLITPFNPSKGYRPVAFSPVTGKILSVT